MTSWCWVRALHLDELEVDRPRALYVEGLPLAFFRVADGAVKCLENHCPRDGRLPQTRFVRPCLLACATTRRGARVTALPFARADGEGSEAGDSGGDADEARECSRYGSSAPRQFTTRIRNRRVEVRLQKLDAAERARRRYGAISGFLREGELAGALRVVAELLESGEQEATIVGAVLEFEATHAPRGLGRVSGLALDSMRLLRDWRGRKFCEPIARALDLAARNHVRRDAIPLVDAAVDFERSSFSRELLQWIQRGRVGEAEALLRRALASGIGLASVEIPLLRACGSHFLDSGETLSLVTRTLEFVRQHPELSRESILCALLRRVVLSDRVEDRPGWGGFRQRIERMEREEDSAKETEPGDPRWSEERFRERILGNRPKDAFDAVLEALRADVAPFEVAAALVAAAAERLLRFDESHAQDCSVHEGWESVLARVLYANTVLQTVERCDIGTAKRLLLQAAHFVQSAGPLDGIRVDWLSSHARPERITAPPGHVLSALGSAIADRRTHDALTLGLSWIEEKGEPFELRELLAGVVMNDHFRDADQSAQALQLVVATSDYLAWYGDGVPARLLVLATLRYFASEISARPIKQIVHESIRFVREGREPECRT